MDVLILTLFVSLVLVLFAIIFLVHRVRAGDVDHGDRLALLPLDPDDPGSDDSRSGNRDGRT